MCHVISAIREMFYAVLAYSSGVTSGGGTDRPGVTPSKGGGDTGMKFKKKNKIKLWPNLVRTVEHSG